MPTENRTTDPRDEMGRLLNDAYARADPSRRAFVAAAKDYGTNHLDQWDKFKFETPYGTVYVSITRADPYPDSFEEISGGR